jgi:hypothetical protein
MLVCQRLGDRQRGSGVKTLSSISASPATNSASQGSGFLLVRRVAVDKPNAPTVRRLGLRGSVLAIEETPGYAKVKNKILLYVSQLSD